MEDNIDYYIDKDAVGFERCAQALVALRGLSHERKYERHPNHTATLRSTTMVHIGYVDPIVDIAFRAYQIGCDDIRRHMSVLMA